jgi:hypothetical protein
MLGFINQALRRVLKVLFPGRKLKYIVSLQSLKNCGPQAKHTDFAFRSDKDQKAMRVADVEKDMPLLFMIAFIDTSIRIWQHSWKNVHEVC